MDRILIIQTAFIGDVVLATGILEKLHHCFPESKLDFLIRKGNEGLFESHPYLNTLLVWDKKNGKYRELLRLLKRIRANKYDKVINVQRFAATGFLTVFSGAREKIGYDKNPLSLMFTCRVPYISSTPAHPKHEIERCNDLIAHFSGDQIFKPKLYPSVADEEKVTELRKEPFIIIAPASVWFTKQYPIEKWCSFLDQLPIHLQVYIIGAANDTDTAQRIINGTRHSKVRSLCGQLSFLQSAALMKAAIMNYVNDSAPMHFASAVDAPTAAIYCSTLPIFGFGPLSAHASIIESKAPPACRPCGLHGLKACPKLHFNCANSIKDSQLLELIA